jgi:hypothetical protein
MIDPKHYQARVHIVGYVGCCSQPVGTRGPQACANEAADL